MAPQDHQTEPYTRDWRANMGRLPPDRSETEAAPMNGVVNAPIASERGSSFYRVLVSAVNHEYLRARGYSYSA